MYELNEANTEYELIEPKLKESDWGPGATTEGSLKKQFKLTDGKLIGNGRRKPPKWADYALIYKNKVLGILEAKANYKYYTDGVAQAIDYAKRRDIRFAFSSNGVKIRQIDLYTNEQKDIDRYPTPQELYEMTFGSRTKPSGIDWQAEFDSIDFADFRGKYQPRYYQAVAVERTLKAIAEGQKRLLLTMATGTGKTATAFHICWKLFDAKWNAEGETKRTPNILFLADRNILANQAMTSFSSSVFEENALARITPAEIRKKGGVPKNANIFFTIFQTFLSGDYEETEDGEVEKYEPFYGEYSRDYFDFIIIDECHRAGAKNGSTWRKIMDYFDSAVQLGLTATPKRKVNADTYKYFGEPLYEYSLKQGIEDGFLSPFKVVQMTSTMDDYTYDEMDKVLSGEIEEGKTYKSTEINRKLFIRERERSRVRELLNMIGTQEKTIVFCSIQKHAAMIRDLINEEAPVKDPLYCVRVTADDGQLGEDYLKTFQNDEKIIPTVLTTSFKLSTGVDAPDVKNIVLMRPVNSIIEFKQIVGRGTRVAEGKDYFTIYDFEKAHLNFKDSEWDGPPQPPGEPRPEREPCDVCGQVRCVCATDPPPPCEICGSSPCICEKPIYEPIEIKLSDNSIRSIEYKKVHRFYDSSGKPISIEEYIEKTYGKLSKLFANEQELRKIWSDPDTRAALLQTLENADLPKEELIQLMEVISNEKTDLFDLFLFIANNKPTKPRIARAENVEANLDNYSPNQQEFIKFVLNQYIQLGYDQLNRDKLMEIIKLKYGSLDDAKRELGSTEQIMQTFKDFQKYLYKELY
ncbi:MAG: EcoAI/FtnUII family type I restriction enzme subunit R [Chlorobiota bacterium]